MRMSELKNIKDISLLTSEEYSKYEEYIPRLMDKGWWLMPDKDGPFAVFDYELDIYEAGPPVVDSWLKKTDGGCGVRPVMRLDTKSFNLQTGDAFNLAGENWTVISKDLAICDSIIADMEFVPREDKSLNLWESSDIKQFIKDWWKESKEKDTKEIMEITLLSVGEAYEYADNISSVSSSCWTRSSASYIAPSYYSGSVYYMDDGRDDYGYPDRSRGIRPALRINPIATDFSVGDKLQVAGETWTMISSELALCDRVIGRIPFRADTGASDRDQWETSDAKQFVENWWRERTKDYFQSMADHIKEREKEIRGEYYKKFGFESYAADMAVEKMKEEEYLQCLGLRDYMEEQTNELEVRDDVNQHDKAHNDIDNRDADREYPDFGFEPEL